ncbi:2-oxo acid dehydrogenase subunit E2 [Thalassococcus sp. S3]|uniref:2-oxo acid dehydrogenase subunit E2 n=1 Tax=Thalassococcus sp. S3 TaxID=2017482 RepID=UPI0013EEB123|nr:2-oxo acid dehydrogenase subunit E2 [Thalassococcus sp. S3]
MAETRLPPMQRHLAKALSHSWSTAPHCTVFADADVTALTALRAELKAKGAAPTVSHFVLTALARALQGHPAFNGWLEGDTLHRVEDINIGLAIALQDGGLMAPVLSDIGGIDAFDMAARTRALADRARGKALSAQDMQGGTFTFSSAGRARTPRYATPLLPLPQLAILAATGIRAEPVVRQGSIKSADILPLSLTFDHRAINGEQANAFLDHLSDRLADPRALLSPQPEKDTP